jgi:hypothetical protein
MDRLVVPHRVGARSAMRLVAFIVLMLAEVRLSVLVFHRSAAEFVTSYASAPGTIGLAAQIGFAIFPVVQIWR